MFTRIATAAAVLGAFLCFAITVSSQTQTLHRTPTKAGTQTPLKKEGRVSQIQVTAVPDTFTGACPAAGKRINFRGSITTTGPADVKFTWVRSDGANDTNPHEVKFAAAGTKQVSDYWMLSESLNGWEALKVTDPNQMTSAHAAFHLKCAAPAASKKPRTMSPSK